MISVDKPKKPSALSPMDKPRTQRHSKRLRTLRQKFVLYFLDFLVVFGGVAVAFFLEDWRASRTEQQAEQSALTSLYGDLNKKHAELVRNRIDLAEAMAQSDTLLNHYSEVAPTDMQRILYSIYRRRISLNHQTPTFQSITSSAEWEYIKSERLKFDIIAAYDEYLYEVNRSYQQCELFRQKLFDHLTNLGLLYPLFLEQGSPREIYLRLGSDNVLRGHLLNYQEAFIQAIQQNRTSAEAISSIVVYTQDEIESLED